MNRRIVTLTLLLSLIVLSAFFIVWYTTLKSSEEMQLLEDIERTIERHQEKFNDEAEDKSDESVEDEETFFAEPIKEFFSDAVNKATELFQHKEIRMTAIGDSLTQGIGDETNQGGYVGVIENMLHTTINQPTVIIDNYGKRGNRTDQLLKRLNDETEEELQESIKSADIILITIGANDVMEVFKQNILDITIEPFLEEQTYYEQRLHNILVTLIDKNEHAKIYLLGIYNPFAQYFEDIEELEIIVNDWNKINENIVTSFEQTSFIPIKDIFEATDEHLFADDNFHPNKLGYERMAERVIDYLTDNEG
ncbi:MAG TPA: SGNH/GDSL hydrolase family protein [Bacillota bacterium]|nr:SGNH/GDSL hydrolase family protein [Bacillota bacterium]